MTGGMFASVVAFVSISRKLSQVRGWPLRRNFADKRFGAAEEDGFVRLATTAQG
jgi:hypothetical protein